MKKGSRDVSSKPTQNTCTATDAFRLLNHCASEFIMPIRTTRLVHSARKLPASINSEKS
jgi:hypothetical protein